jgi:signal transduction histidine kinase
LVVHTDRTKVDRMLTNLVSNAIKFTSSGSVTVVTGLAADGRPQVEVHDTGPGIAPEDRERIFHEFTRANDANVNGEPGWGMGLAICRRFADLLDATLEVDSEPNVGSTFRILLPAHSIVQADRGACAGGRADATGTA